MPTHYTFADALHACQHAYPFSTLRLEPEVVGTYLSHNFLSGAMAWGYPTLLRTLTLYGPRMLEQPVQIYRVRFAHGGQPLAYIVLARENKVACAVLPLVSAYAEENACVKQSS